MVILSFNKVNDPRLAIHRCVEFMTRLNRNVDSVCSVNLAQQTHPALNTNLMIPDRHLATVDPFRWTLVQPGM